MALPDRHQRLPHRPATPQPTRAAVGARWSRRKPAKAGALAYGDGPVAAALLVIALILVSYISVRRAAGESPRPAETSGRRSKSVHPVCTPECPPAWVTKFDCEGA
jgi:hypothetical protein